jgi:hypothetical protein
MRITIYKNCKLSNKYEEVFKSTTLLNTYLSTLSSLVIYNGDDIYFTNSGTLSIDNESTFDGSKYNYMKIEVNASITRYAFINSIVVVNGVAVIDYSEDTWNNYAIDNTGYSFNIKHSILAQATTLSASSEYTATEINELPKKLPIEFEGHNRPYFVISDDNPLETSCYVIVTASLYKLNTNHEVNTRLISNYLVSYQRNNTVSPAPIVAPEDAIEHKTWPIDANTLYNISEIIAISSDAAVQNLQWYDYGYNWKFEILNVKLIPYSIGHEFFSSLLSSNDDCDAGITYDFETSINKWGVNTTDGTPTAFPTSIKFYNLMRSDVYRYKDGNGDYRWTHNGIIPKECPYYDGTIEQDWQTFSIGNFSRTIPNTPDGQDHSYRIYFNADADSNNLTLCYNNSVYDISSDFTLQFPINVQSADITQQQQIAQKTGNLVTMLGLAKDGANLGWSIGSAIGKGTSGMSGGSMGAVSGIGSGVSQIVAQGVSIASTGIQLDASNQAQYVTNKAISTNDLTLYNCMLGGLRDMQSDPVNSTLVNKAISEYGYLYKIIVNDITLLSNSAYVRFDTINVYGNFSQVIAREIETILTNGIVVNV